MNPEWLLLDTHIWFWWVEPNARLPHGIRQRIAEGSENLAISAATVYEFVLQVQRGRIEIDLSLDDWLHGATAEAGVTVWPVNLEIARAAASLPMHHGDPLDRIIVATALSHNAFIASVDQQFGQYEILSGRLIQN